MPAYVPLFDRPPYSDVLYPSTSTQEPQPAYAPPDIDPTLPLSRPVMSSSDGAQEDYDGPEPSHSNGHSSEAGPSRKRPRPDHGPSDGQQRGGYQPRGEAVAPAPPRRAHRGDMPIIPSLFGIEPRNEFTKTVGEFILANCRGREYVEIEMKLGMLMLSAGGQQQRVRLPTMTETILPPDYPAGQFASTMTKSQHASLNRLLNEATQSSLHTASPIRFTRAQNVDSFYPSAGPAGGGKVRVSRDRQGRVVENGVVRKRRVADINVFSPREVFDWRVSVSTEEPCDMPTTQPSMVRDKDRACYQHQLVQVDLTYVQSKTEDGQSTKSYELEIEILDVPSLLAEGEKEERGEPNRFDEMLQSCLDSVRMLIRNVG